MLKVGVVGCGQWGLNHIRVLNGLKGCRVTHAADPDEARRARVQEQFESVQCEADSRAVLQDPNLDAVVIATPASTHFALTEAALRGGKHVLCEKPLCLHVAEAQALTALAMECKRLLMVGHVFLFNPGIVKLKELIREGALGKVYYLSATRTNLGPIRDDVNAAYDLATHDVSIANWLLEEEPSEVSATGSAFIQPGIEDAVFITLRYPQGTIVNIQASWLSPRKIRQITAVGSQKMVTWDDLELSTPVTIYDKGAMANNEYAEWGDFLRISMWDGDVRLPKIQMVEPLKVQDRAFLNGIESGTLERSGAEFSTGVVRVLEAIAHSVRGSGAPGSAGAGVR